MQPSADMLQIDTPENVTFEYDVSGIGSRFLAALVDTVIVVLAEVIVIAASVWASNNLIEDALDSSSGTAFAWILAIFSLIAFVLFWGYYIFFEIAWNGQTPGKRLTSIRVIRMDGTPVGASEVVIRNLVRLIDLLPAAYGIGVVSMFVTEKSRRIGDLAAGTVVVHDRPASRAVGDLQTDRARALSTIGSRKPLPQNFPIERVTESDLSLIEEYLLRRHQLANSQQLAVHLLNSLTTRLGLGPDFVTASEADDLLVAIYRGASPRQSV